MLVVGLTGSIGMGKSAAAAHFRSRDIPVFDADAEVHRLYSSGGAAVPAIEAAFPGTTSAAGVDRAKLAAALLREPSGFRQLESIVHPLVRDAQRHFLHGAHERGATLAVLEIPLLLETGGDANVDAVIVVSAPPDVQRTRVLQRPGMTPEKLEQIVARQLPDAAKRARADFIVDTGGALTATQAQIDRIIEKLGDRPAAAYARAWA